ncbi:hypothetical protein P43SY_010406 [Pythium insidiosum]|uniref:Kazal-like domain-containing protein n=1 Tax=Pythium insidiosum TaxID=114742 RepID=A0AAD5L4Y9_PYTIN|nr:hypothetical protein P43SY_010406 [Pythium insidiosum]
MLETAKCQTRDDKLVVKHDGACAATQPNAGANCDIACTREYKPVCGTDFLTYPNECALTVARCQKRDAKLVVMHAGACPPCNNVCTLRTL